MFNNLPSFYNSSEWKCLRQSLISKRLNNYGETICESCGKPIINNYDCIAHHVQPLTMANVNDYAISLNPNNIQIVHAKCHNEIHARFGYCTERKVYYVYGAPCSGKTTFVNQIKGNSDIVIDMDNIWQCITGGQRYDKPNALKQNAFAVRDCLFDMIKKRYGRWERAFIITSGAVKGIREREIESFGAEAIYIDTDIKTCLQRLATDETRTVEQKKEWNKYIVQWFNDYTE